MTRRFGVYIGDVTQQSDGQIRVHFTRTDSLLGQYSDNLYFPTQANFDAAAEADIIGLEDARFQAWVDFINAQSSETPSDWNPDTLYNVDEQSVFNGDPFIANVQNQNARPDLNPEVWRPA